MKWLLDEMLPPATCKQLVAAGHDAVSVVQLGLGGAEDDHIFHLAARERRVLVTENFADYSVLLEQCVARGAACVPVVFVRRPGRVQRGALPNRLARSLLAWARKHPDPYLGPHWV